MDPQNSTHWFSYSKYEGPGQTSIGNGCMISVVLDGAARHHFSGIRLIVVYKESEFLDNVKLTDCLQTNQFGVLQSGESDPTYRDLLNRRSASLHCSKSLLQAASTSSLNLPLCTVVFELVDTSNDLTYAVALNLRRNLTSTPSTDTTATPFRIAYDRVHPCTGAFSSEPSLLAFLECTHSFHGIRRPTHQYSCCMRMASGIPAYSVRVLPVSTERAPCPVLPAHVIRTIVADVVGVKGHGWRKSLLAYGLVCKAWVHVLDLFFGGLPARYDGDMADATKVARSLERRPERAVLMRSFSPWDYYMTEGEEEYKEMCVSLMTILRLGTGVRDVKLSLIHESVARELVQRLGELREVRTCVVYPTYDESRDARKGLSMRDIQTFIARWVNLRKLELHEWVNEGPADLETGDEDLTPPLECKIEHLILERGRLTGPQFLRFASPFSPPVLKRLDLEAVQGISNADFLAFLMQVAPTLTSLTVRECTFPRGKTIVEGKIGKGKEKKRETQELESGAREEAEEEEETETEEEHAIDTAMPHLTSLTQLTADGKSASALSISRKPLSPLSPPDSTPLAIIEKGLNRRLHSISIGNAYGMSLASVLGAVQGTQWGAVSVMWHGAQDYDEVEVGRVVGEVFGRRGVRLSCHNFDVAYVL
ncbi:hypothetical protein Hypma_009156 [Hypsizygus marmoreus]|uniref:Uncharacterized protein n=1 Tax=Hypsizygus marmoreus TaxID=39966 RepID=A0A369JN68_HYPMA|nr:hypothetical protein Hypma_009156 [Hypsizygus marmoreus]